MIKAQGTYFSHQPWNQGCQEGMKQNRWQQMHTSLPSHPKKQEK
jgi:hypothetical protein